MINWALYTEKAVGQDSPLYDDVLNRSQRDVLEQSGYSRDGDDFAGFAKTTHTHDASAIVSGTMTTSRGGTGLSAPTAGGLLIAAAAAAMTLLAPGAAAQVVRSTGSAWASSALAFADLASVPTTVAGYGITDVYTKTAADARYAAIAGPFPWGDVSGTPTTLAGYGVTDAYTKTASDARFAPIVVPWSTITGTPTTIAGYGISALPWANLTGVPTTIAGFGITDAYTKTESDARYPQAIAGTLNRIAVGGTVTSPSIDIAATYVGQTSLTTLGTVTTGTWHAGVIDPVYGGTGVNNGASLLTLAGNLTTVGAFGVTFTATGATAVTLPTSGTLATIAGNVATATALQTARAINGVSFNGTADVTVTAATPHALTIGTHLTGTSFDGSGAVTIATDATSANTNSTIVARDGNGAFSATTITAALIGNVTGSVSGNAGTATVLATPRAINGVAFDGSAPITVPAAAGTLTGTALNATVVTSSLTSVGTLTAVTTTGLIKATVVGEQLRLGYDLTNYVSFSVSAVGALTITPQSGQAVSVGALASSGTAVLSGQTRVGDLFRVESIASPNVAGLAGAGVEIHYDPTNKGVIKAYDYTGTAFVPLTISALNLVLSTTSGITVSGGGSLKVPAVTAGADIFSLDVTPTAAISIANNGTSSLFSGETFSGLLVISETTTAIGSAVFLVSGYSGVALVSQVGNNYSVTATSAGKANVYLSGGNVVIENKIGTTCTFRVMALRSHTA